MDRRNKTQNKSEATKKYETKTNWSSITGVPKLELAKMHLFPVVRRQLHLALSGEFGKQADFLIGADDLAPKRPSVQSVRSDYRDLDTEGQKTMLIDLLKKYEVKKEKFMENNQKIFSKMLTICDEALLDKIMRIPEFEETRHAHNCVKLWEYISSVVGDDGKVTVGLSVPLADQLPI